MKYSKNTILYIEFDDHVSTSPSWETLEEFKKKKEGKCIAVGFYVMSDEKAIYISTMNSEDELGSGHVILHSCITHISELKIPKKPVLKPIQAPSK